MKKIGLTLVALLLAAATYAPVASAEIEVSGDAYVSINSMYLWRGFDLSNNEPADANFVVQPGADISFKGLTVGWWGNFNENSGEMDEVDFILDYSFDPAEILSVSVGNILYDVDGLKDTNELYLSLTLNTILSPSVSVYWDYDEFDSLFYSASVGHTFELSEKLGLNVGALASYYDSLGDYSDLHNGELSASVDYALTDQIAISPAVIFSTPLSDDAEDVAGLDDEFMAGVTFALNF